MSLDIENSIADQLPSMVKEALSKMPAEKQAQFVEEYKRKEKNPVLMIILAVIFPIQLFLLGKVGLGIAYWLTGGGCGIWWIIEIILASKRTKEYNEDVAKSIMRDMKVMS